MIRELRNKSLLLLRLNKAILLSLLTLPTAVLASAQGWQANGQVVWTTSQVGIGGVPASDLLEVVAPNAAIGVGASLGTNQSTGLQFLDYGVQHAGFRWSNDGTGNLYLEDASVSGNPATWFGNHPVNLFVRNGSVTSTGGAVLGKSSLGMAGTLGINDSWMSSPLSSRLSFGTDGTGWGLGIAANKSGTLSNLMFIRDDGHVGIGTLTPQYSLSVNGAIQAKEVIVNTGWSDFVFDRNYKLQSLQSIAAYINEHHHLPGMPSASDVKQHGISLGDIESKLLAKMEELTLHMIQLEQENERLRSEMHAEKEHRSTGLR